MWKNWRTEEINAALNLISKYLSNVHTLCNISKREKYEFTFQFNVEMVFAWGMSSPIFFFFLSNFPHQGGKTLWLLLFAMLLRTCLQRCLWWPIENSSYLFCCSLLLFRENWVCLDCLGTLADKAQRYVMTEKMCSSAGCRETTREIRVSCRCSVSRSRTADLVMSTIVQRTKFVLNADYTQQKPFFPFKGSTVSH